MAPGKEAKVEGKRTSVSAFERTNQQDMKG